MATHIALGFSSATDPVTAFRDAAVMAKSLSGLPKHDLALIAVTPSYAASDNPKTLQALDALRRVLLPEKCIGTTAPALIWTKGVENKGVLVMAFSSDEIDVGLAARSAVSLAPLQETGLKFARELASTLTAAERHGALILCNPMTLNHTLLIRGFQEGLGRAFMMSGAINPGGIFLQDKFLTDAVGGIIFGGRTSFITAIRHGWQPLGKPRTIDSADGNLIRTISGKPAAAIYRDYFPDELPSLPAGELGDIGLLYPLGLNTPRPKDYIIKSPSGSLPDGSLVCQGDIPRGTQVHLMIGDKDACRQAAHDAAVEVHNKLHGRHPKIVFIFASLSRKKLFGRAAGQEFNHIKEILGLSCPVFGMYTYGEIGASVPMDLQVHNAGLMITALE